MNTSVSTSFYGPLDLAVDNGPILRSVYGWTNSTDANERALGYANVQLAAWAATQGHKLDDAPALPGYNAAWQDAYAYGTAQSSQAVYYGVPASLVDALETLRSSRDIVRASDGSWNMSPALTLDVAGGNGRASLVAQLSPYLRFNPAAASAQFVGGASVQSVIQAQLPAPVASAALTAITAGTLPTPAPPIVVAVPPDPRANAQASVAPIDVTSTGLYPVVATFATDPASLPSPVADAVQPLPSSAGALAAAAASAAVPASSSPAPAAVPLASLGSSLAATARSPIAWLVALGVVALGLSLSHE